MLPELCAAYKLRRDMESLCGKFGVCSVSILDAKVTGQEGGSAATAARIRIARHKPVDSFPAPKSRDIE